MSLKTINEQFQYLNQLLESSDLTSDEILEMGNRIDELKEESKGKVDKWVYFFQALDSRMELVQKQIVEFQALKQKINKIKAASKDYLIYLAQRGELPEILEGEFYTIRIQDSPLSVHAEEADLEALKTSYPQFVTEKVSLFLNKAAVKSSFELGESLPDNIWLEQGKHIRVIPRKGI